MALKRTIARLNDYSDRLERGKANKIKLRHVERVIDKLRLRDKSLRKEIEAASKPGRRKRLTLKRKAVQVQLTRAKWLRKEIRKQR